MGWLAELKARNCAAAGRRDELSRWPGDTTWSRGDLRDQLMAVGGWCTVCCQHGSLVNCFFLCRMDQESAPTMNHTRYSCLPYRLGRLISLVHVYVQDT
jgi:hypothetical protein